MLLPDANDNLNPAQDALASLLPFVQAGVEISRQLRTPAPEAPVPGNPRVLNRTASWWTPTNIALAVGGVVLLLFGGILLLRPGKSG